MNEIENLLKDTAERLFGDLCDAKLLQLADQGHWCADAWKSIEETGLIQALDPEGDDTTLLPLSTLAITIRAAGEFAVPLPIMETLLAQRQLAQACLPIPEGALSIARAPNASLRRVDGEWLLSASLRNVPWGRRARAIVFEALHNDQKMLVCLPGMTPTKQGQNLANEDRDSFELRDFRIANEHIALKSPSARSIELEGALFRSLQMVGALGRILGMTVQYSMERVQFGRPIGKFQAVQHQVATMATHIAAATAATEAAVNCANDREADFEIQAAKLRASEAASVCCRIAHQVHGAMGFTHEHSLHFFTRRLMSWRDEFGSESECAEWIGAKIQAIGGKHLWSFISTPQLLATAQMPQGSPRHE